MGTRDLNFYSIEQIKRVRLVKRAIEYYCAAFCRGIISPEKCLQFAISVERNIEILPPTHQTISLDVCLDCFYIDSLGNKIKNSQFYRTREKKLKSNQKLVFRKIQGFSDRSKTRHKLAYLRFKISRQRFDRANCIARCVIASNDVVAFKDLRIQNLGLNRGVTKLSDTSWHQLRVWLKYLGEVFGWIIIAINPQYTSPQGFNCGAIVDKFLSTRTYVCQCRCVSNRDENAALNILKKGLSTVGHTGTLGLDSINASGETTSTLAGKFLFEQASS